MCVRILRVQLNSASCCAQPRHICALPARYAQERRRSARHSEKYPVPSATPFRLPLFLILLNSKDTPLPARSVRPADVGLRDRLLQFNNRFLLEVGIAVGEPVLSMDDRRISKSRQHLGKDVCGAGLVLHIETGNREGVPVFEVRFQRNKPLRTADAPHPLFDFIASVSQPKSASW